MAILVAGRRDVLNCFAEGKYEIGNLNPVPAEDHFAATGDTHRQIKGLPDGSKVKLVVTQ